MEKEIALALNNVLKQFAGMKFDLETLEYLEIEVNDMLHRQYPEFSAEFRVFPKYIEDRNSIQFISTRKH